MIFPAGTYPWNDTPAFPGAHANWVFLGDSITLTGEVLMTHPQRVAALVLANNGVVIRWVRVGINGASPNYAWPLAGYPNTMTQDVAARVAPALSTVLPNYVTIFGGTNGMLPSLGAHTAAQEFIDLEANIDAVIALGVPARNIRVICCLPRTGLDEATKRTPYNTNIVSDPHAKGYVAVRTDLNPFIGAAGQNLDPTYFLQPQGVHPTDAGQQILAQIEAATFP